MQTDTERSELVGGCYRRLAVKDGVADFIADISSNSFSQGVGTLAAEAATNIVSSNFIRSHCGNYVGAARFPMLDYNSR